MSMAKTTTSVKKRSKSPAPKPKGASSNKSAKKLSSVRSRSKSAVPSKNQATVAPKAKAKAKKQNFVMELFFPSSDGLPTSERVVHHINIIGWQIKVDSVAVRVCAVDCTR